MGLQLLGAGGGQPKPDGEASGDDNPPKPCPGGKPMPMAKEETGPGPWQILHALTHEITNRCILNGLLIWGQVCQQRGPRHITLHAIFNDANMSSPSRLSRGTACESPPLQRKPLHWHTTLPHNPMTLSTHGGKWELKN